MHAGLNDFESKGGFKDIETQCRWIGCIALLVGEKNEFFEAKEIFRKEREIKENIESCRKE